MAGILKRLGGRAINLALALVIVGAGYTVAVLGLSWWSNRHLSQIAVIMDTDNAECDKPYGVVVGYTNITGRTLRLVIIRYTANKANTPIEVDVLENGTLNFDVPTAAGETWSVCHSLMPKPRTDTSVRLTLNAQLIRASF
ncbi:hypothetical protein [Phyllobacterium lublinensis]|uniref:hypothetical protein n=1 Tax=Phyllobacterium lublinensis TaxID=2875708 RepID=UPI001CCE39C8|nr:hypothetical protein [Phyllobacterium sp. 2063]MBZ9655032.1 hypothetical protein [Phyllobacterium sp. 2063]